VKRKLLLATLVLLLGAASAAGSRLPGAGHNEFGESVMLIFKTHQGGS
jgi:hypothetical protein